MKSATIEGLQTGVLLAVCTLLVAGCGGLPSQSTAGPETSLVPASSEPEGSTPRDIAEAVRFREMFGLQADETWVRLVASNPAADEGRLEYGVPLLPSELRELDVRPSFYRPVADAVSAYGAAHPEEWAGLWIDQSRDGLVVAQFSARADEHDAALRRMLHPEALLEVKDVRWSLVELNALGVTIRKDFQKDDGWLDELPAKVTRMGIDEKANQVFMNVSSASSDADEVIRSHFGVTEDILWVESDGVGAAFLPFGTISVLAVDAHGRPVPNLDCGAVRVGRDATGGVDVFATTDRNGRCSFVIRAFQYTVHLSATDGAGEPKTVGTGPVDVPGNGVASIMMVIDDAAMPTPSPAS